MILIKFIILKFGFLLGKTRILFPTIVCCYDSYEIWHIYIRIKKVLFLSGGPKKFWKGWRLETNHYYTL